MRRSPFKKGCDISIQLTVHIRAVRLGLYIGGGESEHFYVVILILYTAQTSSLVTALPYGVCKP